eukprot:CAMPEP_0196692268 /NCGR_PEP_ID=MMETSP1090-20130531/27048_1 /TAXON_ID=37098 /ORGANISM="Isochrysis sp, Strain CCMP1244" /LENGTH=59 /DNA_ID=CAMNT_0042031615 /DNA_START=149 /DNA_END=324 /DNA_ORIENTATION=+
MSPRHHAPRAVGEAAGEHTVVEQRLGEGDGGVGGGEEEPRFAVGDQGRVAGVAAREDRR